VGYRSHSLIKKVLEAILELASIDGAALLSLLLTLLIAAMNIHWGVKALLILPVWIAFGVYVYRMNRR